MKATFLLRFTATTALISLSLLAGRTGRVGAGEVAGRLDQYAAADSIH
jgi:hypothetical protein